jgi:hypothetical protein
VKAKPRMAALFFFCGLLSSGPTSAGNSPANSARPADAAIPRSIPLRIFRDYLVVAEGQFGGRLQHQNFVLDTGTAPSIIDTKSLRELGLATTASTMVAMGKVIPTGIAILPELDLGPLKAVSLRVQVQDLSRLERDLGISVAGIIGLDVLSKSSFRLDYEKKQMEFGQVSDEGIPVSFDARTTRQRGSSVADQGMEVQVFFAPDIAFGGKHFTLEKAYFIPDASYPAFDGILGVRALGFRAIAYDQARAALFLQK